MMKRLNSETMIVVALRGDISRGVLGPGTPLLQDTLAARFNVSRVPIRDAIKALEAEGLITLLPNRTAIVTVLSVADVEEIFVIRTMLECDLIRRATKLATSADHKVVEELIGMLDAVRTGERFAALDRELHEALYAPAASPRQFEIVSQLGQQVARFYRSSLELSSYHDKCQIGHRDVVQAFLQRNANQAAASLTKHLCTAKLKIIELIETQE